ncbi:hypothetical protein V6N12_054579 [Hibiscus sabdariffa]|uniref:Leucine-rich repeat-containing N-terminal plant-type domain-containing protein n=1 Tax=Hibiscus sabdariffa TaxID=183260 RepID=A0ABR2D0V6_9ROSI
MVENNQMGNTFLNLPLLIIFHFSMPSSSIKLPNIFTDQSALLALKDHVTHDPGNVLTTTWSTSTPVCNWFGVSCGPRHRRVTALDLTGLGLVGTLPPHGEIPSWLGSLTELRELSLNYNMLSGPIPKDMYDDLPSLEVLNLRGMMPQQIGNLTNLEILSLGYNNLVGPIPPAIFNASTLSVIDLESNQLSGSLPSNMGPWLPNLKYLILGSNQLVGSFPIEIAGLKDLTHFSLSSNRITGSIPESFGDLLSLESLDLSRNSLSGEIPKSLEKLCYLDYFNASFNRLEGEILDGGSFANWKNVTNLDFSGNNLSGAIPDRICDLNSGLRYLGLNDNQLEGALPLSLINCSELVILNVANNKLSDTFPHWLGTLPRLRVLILSSNRFHGSIQDSIATSSFPRLQMLDLSGNDFTGLLPTNFFQNLKALRQVVEYEYEYDDYRYSVNVTIRGLELPFTITVAIPIFTCTDLSLNGFHGEIPEAIGELSMLLALNLSHNTLTDLTFLEVLKFQNNNLVGSIPRGKQFETFQNDSYAGNLDLCEFPLSKECGNVEGSQTEKHKVNGKGIAFIWKVALMGYGSGMVLEISMAYVVFTTGRPWWLVRMIERDLKEKITSWIQKKKKDETTGFSGENDRVL